jgi:integrase
MALTDVSCRNAQPSEKPYKLTDSEGLYLLVQPNGSKLWRYKYRFAGKEKTLSIGQYPNIKLVQARDERTKAKKLVVAGQDPSMLKQEARRLSVAKTLNTFEGIANEWMSRNEKGKWTERYTQTVRHRLEKDIYPFIGKLPISDITTPRLALVIEAIEKRGAADVARRCLQYSRGIFAYAKVRGQIVHNPADIKASDILAPAIKGHFAAMEPKQLPDFLVNLYSNRARLFRQTQLAIEMMMLTFVRTGELIKAEWSEFDFKDNSWTIPACRMKMKRKHIVPLSAQVLKILAELRALNGHRKYVFPSQRTPKEHMSNNAILVAIKRMGYGGIHTGHGFRALATTILLETLKYPMAIIDVQMAHAKKSDVEAAYNRAHYWDDRVKMMQDWSDFVEHLINEKNQGKLNV